MLKYSYDTRPDMIYLVEIPAEYIEESHLPYEIVLSLLEDDDVDLSCIQSIRILNKQHNAYLLLKETSRIKLEDAIDILVFEYRHNSNEIADSIGQIQAEIADLRHTSSVQTFSPQLTSSLSNYDESRSTFRHPTPIAQQDTQSPWQRIMQNKSPINRRDSMWSRSSLVGFTSRQSIRSKSMKTDQQIDLVVFHSAPLVKKERDIITPLNNQTLDFEIERRLILETLKRNDIGANIRFDAATTEKLIEVLDYQPKIIHISWHGYYDDYKGNCFYLAFEHQTQLGVLDSVTAERLQKLLSQTKPYEGIVLVSALYSGTIGQTFLDAGFPCVVCVHSKDQILDDAAKRFASAFYRTIFTGKSIQQSFDSAKALVEDQQTTKVDSCCCTHVHKPDCKWYSRNLPSDQMHEEHVPKCKCIGNANNIHNISCPWANDFMLKFGPDDWDFTDEEFLSGKFTVCCCSPEIPHGEGLKFSLMTKDVSFKENCLFKKHTKSEIETVAALPECFRPPYLGKQILGRHVEIQKMVEAMSSSDTNSRVIFLTGESGLGKSDVLKTAAMYAFERRVFTDGVIYCDLKNRRDSSSIINTVAKQLNIPGISSKELLNAIHNLHLLIIFDNASHLMEVKTEKFEEKIRFLLENTTGPKFVIISRGKYYWDVSVEMQLTPLSNQFAIKLLKSFMTQDRYDEIDEKTESLIQIIGNYPKKIQQIAPLLRDISIDDFIEEMTTQSNLSLQKQLSYNSMDILQNHNENALRLLKLISCFPSGLFATDIEFLMEDVDYDWKEALDILTDAKNAQKKKNTSWLVSCKSDVKKIKEKYYIAIDWHKYKTMESSEQPSENQEKAIKYLSALSRGILLALISNKSKNKAQYDSHIISFNAALGNGIWSPLFANDSLEIAENISEYPEERFKVIEENFWAYARDAEYQNLDVENETAEQLGEMFICVTSIFILMDKITPAINFVVKALECCDMLSNEKQKAILELILANALVRDGDIDESKSYALEAQKKFRYIRDNDGLAESYLLMAVMNGTGFQDPNLEDLPPLQLSKVHSELQRRATIEFHMTTEELFDQAYRNFNKVGNTFGRARVLLSKAEWRIRSKKMDEVVLSCLNQAHGFFEMYDPKVWDLRCLIALGEYYAENRNWTNARQNYNLAKKLAKSVKDRAQEVFVKHKLQYVFAQIRKESSSNITVLKGMPMVEQSPTGEYNRIGPVARYFNSHLSQDVIQSLSECHKEVNIKVDLLTRTSLEQAREGSRILVLSSDVYSDLHLVCEGNCTAADRMSTDEIKSILGTDLRNQGIEVVIFAQPQSVTLGEFFSRELNVPHVIAFDFPNLTCEDDHSQYNILTWQVIFNFTFSFFKHVIQNHSVREAVNKSIETVKGSMMFVIKQFDSDMATTQIFDSYGPVLINKEDPQHDKWLFECSELSEYSKIARGTLGNVSNLSSSLGPTNLQHISTCFSARHLELHNTLLALTNSKWVCITADGIHGSGKTHFLTTMGHFVRSRNLYPDGVYAFDLRKIYETAKVDKLLSMTGLNTNSYEYKSLLLIFDNVDKLVQQTVASFKLLLKFYIEQCGFSILMSTNSALNIPGISFKSIDLKPLTPIESATMLAVNTRPIKKTEITDKDTNEGVITLLQEFEGLKACKGNPKRIMDLAEELKKHQLGEVRQKHEMVSKIFSWKFTPSLRKVRKPSMDFQDIIHNMKNIMFDTNAVKDRQASPRMDTEQEIKMPQLERMRNDIFNPEIVKQALGINKKETKTIRFKNPTMPSQKPKQALQGFLKRKQPIIQTGIKATSKEPEIQEKPKYKEPPCFYPPSAQRTVLSKYIQEFQMKIKSMEKQKTIRAKSKNK